MSKLDYHSYIRSPAWKAVKIRYLKSDMPKDCGVCDAPWSNAMVFHHKTYKNLGNERLMDICPVCAPCHELIHDVHRKNPHRGLWWALKGARTLAKQPDSELAFGPYGPGNLTFEPIGVGARELTERLVAELPVLSACSSA
jgi:hypothetical protein